MKDFAWNDKNTALLKDMWERGETAAAIADRIGTSRGSVIGRANRVGCLKRVQERRPSPVKQNNNAADTGHRGARAAAMGEPPAPAPGQNPTALLDLKHGQCRFPLGAPLEKATRFCGAARISGKPYCPHHHAIANRKILPPLKMTEKGIPHG